MRHYEFDCGSVNCCASQTAVAAVWLMVRKIAFGAHTAGARGPGQAKLALSSRRPTRKAV